MVATFPPICNALLRAVRPPKRARLRSDSTLAGSRQPASKSLAPQSSSVLGCVVACAQPDLCVRNVTKTPFFIYKFGYGWLQRCAATRPERIADSAPQIGSVCGGREPSAGQNPPWRTPTTAPPASSRLPPHTYATTQRRSLARHRWLGDLASAHSGRRTRRFLIRKVTRAVRGPWLGPSPHAVRFAGASQLRV